jgi:hypothetical protein
MTFNPFWSIVAWAVSRPAVSAWLIRRARKTPYQHITSADGKDVYMRRWWLFNPYPSGKSGRGGARHKWCPISIRVHHILRPDQDRHLHDHPWNARTVVLAGYYVETRGDGEEITRRTGSTATLRFGEFHRISEVSPGGVATLFITGRYRGTWGFKIPHREYLEV